MAYSSAAGYGEPAWGPARPPVQQPYPPSLGPQPSGALAIVAFIASLVAFFFGWVPFLGLALGAIGLLLSIIAVRTPVLRGLSIAGIVLSTIAGLTSLVTTGLFLLALLGSSGPAPSQEAAASHSRKILSRSIRERLQGSREGPGCPCRRDSDPVRLCHSVRCRYRAMHHACECQRRQALVMARVRAQFPRFQRGRGFAVP